MKKGTYGKVIVSLILIINVAFTATCLYGFIKTGSEPAVLITTWFGFSTTELVSLASIKKSKTKKGTAEREG